MLHSRKMAVIPEATLQKLQQQQSLSNAPLSHLSDLDKQMSSILDDPSLPADIKLKKYRQVLGSYTSIRDQEVKRPLRMEINEPKSTNVLEGVPRHYVNKARTLMENVKHNPYLELSDKNEIIYKGEVIPGSNIVDLLHTYTRPSGRRVKTPKGWQEFGQALLENNAPRSAIANEELWGRIERKPADEEDEEEEEEEYFDLTEDDEEEDERPPTPEPPRRSNRARKAVVPWTPYVQPRKRR